MVDLLLLFLLDVLVKSWSGFVKVHKSVIVVSDREVLLVEVLRRDHLPLAVAGRDVREELDAEGLVRLGWVALQLLVDDVVDVAELELLLEAWRRLVLEVLRELGCGLFLLLHLLKVFND